MKLLLFTDVHFRSISSFSPFNKADSEGATIELKNAEKSIRFVCECVEEYKPDLVVCLGDTYNNLNTNSNMVVSSASKSIGKLYDVCRSVSSRLFILNGNHDYISKNYSMIDSLKGKLIKRPIELDNMIFIPFIYPQEDMRIEIVKALVSGRYKYIFIHDEINGFSYNKKVVIENSIDVNNYSGDFVIYAGHIHMRQLSDKVKYIGSVRQVAPSEYSECGNGCELIDLNSNTSLFIKNRYVKPVKSVNMSDLEFVNFDEYDGLVIYFNNVEEYEINKDKLDIPIPYIVRIHKRVEKQKRKVDMVDYMLPVNELIHSYVYNNYPDLKEYLNRYIKLNGGE